MKCGECQVATTNPKDKMDCYFCPFDKVDAFHSLHDCSHLSELVERMAELLKEQQPKTGRWIDKDEGIARCSARCSRCEKESSGFAIDNGFSFDYSYHDYCPKCGAKMENPKEG